MTKYMRGVLALVLLAVAVGLKVYYRNNPAALTPTTSTLSDVALGAGAALGVTYFL
jgi:hypothetical protein